MDNRISGPWYLADWSTDNGPNTFVIEAREKEVLNPGQSSLWPGGIRKIKIADTEEGDGDRIAHARLISAAPDLLEVAKLALSCDVPLWLKDAASEAIAKAEGQG